MLVLFLRFKIIRHGRNRRNITWFVICFFLRKRSRANKSKKNYKGIAEHSFIRNLKRGERRRTGYEGCKLWTTDYGLSSENLLLAFAAVN